MTFIRPYRISIITLLLLFNLADISAGQIADSTRHFLAADLTLIHADTESFTAEDLQKFREAGISILLVEPGTSLPPDEQLMGFNLILFSGNAYSTVLQIESDLSAYTQSLKQNIENFQQNYPGKLAAVELFRFPNDLDPDFFQGFIRRYRFYKNIYGSPSFFTAPPPTLLTENPGPFPI